MIGSIYLLGCSSRICEVVGGCKCERFCMMSGLYFYAMICHSLSSRHHLGLLICAIRAPGRFILARSLVGFIR
jgi:hypothetical protein